jgi:hypothetical protein
MKRVLMVDKILQNAKDLIKKHDPVQIGSQITPYNVKLDINGIETNQKRIRRMVKESASTESVINTKISYPLTNLSCCCNDLNR